MAKNAFNDSDDEDDDSFVTIGTPLTTYDKDEAPVRKPVGIHEQTVRDNEGRVRFHGAFTGGFSAGYFNSVGSKEGWAPKTFTSSRVQRAEGSSTQKPEDFMDEEDFGEFGIAPKVIGTRENFASNERERKRKQDAAAFLSTESVIPGAESLLVDLVLPKKSSIGVRLLRKLGWKEGQGIGPRTKKKHTRKKGSSEAATGGRVYGCSMPPGYGSEHSEASSSEDSCPESVTFAPKDVCPISFEPKSNLHGIGYRGLDPLAALGHVKHLEPALISKSGKRGIRGQAFGVGALEHEDEDIYSLDSMTNYDTVLGDEPSDAVKFGWSGGSRPRPSAGDSKLKAIGHTATDVLPGFKRAATPLAPRKTFPPPQLPRDFRPFHRFEAKEPVAGTAEASGVSSKDQRKLDPYSRGALLGETPHLNSVFELVSGEDRAKMEAAKMQADIEKGQRRSVEETPNDVPVDKSSATTSDTSSSLRGSQSGTHQSTPTAVTPQPAAESAVAASSGGSIPQLIISKHGGFSPFARNPEKQKRYERYLEAIKSGAQYVPSDGIHTTEWEREREREEFAQAARLYRPLSAMIASRFTRAKYDDDEKVSADADSEKNAISDRAKAVALKMFGKLTREQFEWHPDKALCKRFNIANPYPESTIVGLTTVKRDKYSIFNFLSFPPQDEESSSTSTVEAQQDTSKASKTAAVATPVNVKPLAILATIDLRPKALPMATKTGNESTAEISTIDNSAQSSQLASTGVEMESGGVAEDSDRPPMDLFKAIFDNSDTDNSSSSEDEEEENGEPKKMDVDVTATSTPAPVSREVLRTGELVIEKSSGDLVPPAAASGDVSQPFTAGKLQQEKRDGNCIVPHYSHAGDNDMLTDEADDRLTAAAAMFGPLPPPTATDESSKLSSAAGHKHRKLHHHTHKHRRHGDSHKSSHKKSKHKKSKKKKKDKKDKKDKKKKSDDKKKTITISSSSCSDADVEDEGTGSSDDDYNATSLDKQLLSRLRSLKAKQRVT